MLLFLLLLLIVVALVPITLVVICLVGTYKVFEKAGVEGWKAIIPFYNIYVLTVDIAKMNWWWFLIIVAGIVFPVIAIVSLVASINVHYVVAKKFTDDEAQIVLTCIFPSIMLCVFGFGGASYTDVRTSPNGFFTSSEEQAQYKSSSASRDTKANAGFCTNCGAALHKGDKFCMNCGKEVVK